MKSKNISLEDSFFANSVCDIRERKENDRFSKILDKLKQYDIIKSYKEFADNIKETSVGLNDIKKGRKKLSINHVKNINVKYPFINTDFILFEEGLPFHEDFLIAYYPDGFEFASYYEFDLEAIKNYKILEEESETVIPKKSKKKYPDDSLMSDLLATKNELLEAKDKIMKLQAEVYELKLKLLK